MHISRKTKVGALVTVVVLGIAGAAFAYFTNSGTGTGDATVGTSEGMTIHGDAPTDLLPGTTSVVNFTVDNPSEGGQFVTTITLVNVDAPDNCLITDFTMPTVTVGEQVPGDAVAFALEATGTITMANTTLNQDACKSGALILNLTST